MSAPLIDHLWQSSLIAAVAWFFALVMRNDCAKARYWIWFAASVKFLIPFSLLTTIGLEVGRHLSPANAISPVVSAAQQASAPFLAPAVTIAFPERADEATPFIPILGVIWALGSATLAARWLVCWLRVQAAIRSAVPTRLTESVQAMTSPTLHEPGVVGIFRPVMLLPDGLEDRLTPEQFQSIIQHELCHVRRRDNLTAAIHMLVESVFWFHPLVWWIGARLIEERERACDEAVVRSGSEPQAYAEGILRVCRLHLASRLPCVAGVSGATLKLRLEGIMKNETVADLSGGKKLMLGVTAVAIVALPVLAALTTSTPARAQAAPAHVVDEGKVPRASAQNAAGRRAAAIKCGIQSDPDRKQLKLSAKDMEVRSLLKCIADAAHVNILISDRVSGTITLNLKDMPWDQALDIVLHSKGLVRREKDGIIFVSSASE